MSSARNATLRDFGGGLPDEGGDDRDESPEPTPIEIPESVAQWFEIQTPHSAVRYGAPTFEIHPAAAAWFENYDPHSDVQECTFCGFLAPKTAWPQHVGKAKCAPAEHSEVFGR